MGGQPLIAFVAPRVRGQVTTWRSSVTLACLAALLLGALTVELLAGAVTLTPSRILHLLAGGIPTQREDAVLWQIRVPRGVLAVCAGAALGLAGAAQQGLFRNPLADPALIGVSSGAALAAVTAIVLGEQITGKFAATLPISLVALVPISAFAGGLLATLAALRLARAAQPRGSDEDTGSLLLAGIAVNAVCAAGTGLLITLSDDRQLRDILFWTMGSLGGGDWIGISGAGVGMLVALVFLLPAARSLDALLLGKREALYLGVNIDRLRSMVVVVTALAVGSAVAVTGIIGFVGLVVPHLTRLLVGSRHQLVLPGAALLGGSLLLLADAAARTVAAPAELPIGLVTSAIGGPFFLVLLWRRGRSMR